MAVPAARHEQLRRYVENRHIDHIPAGARHGKPALLAAPGLASRLPPRREFGDKLAKVSP